MDSDLTGNQYDEGPFAGSYDGTDIDEEAVDAYADELRRLCKEREQLERVPINGQISTSHACKIATEEMPFGQTVFHQRFKKALDRQSMGAYKMVDLKELARQLLRWTQLGYPDPRRS